MIVKHTDKRRLNTIQNTTFFMKRHLLYTLIFTLCYLYPTLSEQKTLNYSIKKVVIDAGHGGKDHGCSGKKSREKKITLDIALKLGQRIKKYTKGVKVIYTRSRDVFVPLHKRAAIANRNNADLFISIHCNASPTHPRAYGTETYVMGVDKSAENLAVARRENSVILLEGSNYQKHYDGYDVNSTESNIVFSLYQNAYLEQSIQLANLIEKQFKYKSKRKSRGVKQESFLVLYKTAMPSVLIEAGFLSNRKDEKYLLSDMGQRITASAIFQAFRKYKEMLEGRAFWMPQHLEQEMFEEAGIETACH